MRNTLSNSEEMPEEPLKELFMKLLVNFRSTSGRITEELLEVFPEKSRMYFLEKSPRRSLRIPAGVPPSLHREFLQELLSKSFSEISLRVPREFLQEFVGIFFENSSGSSLFFFQNFLRKPSRSSS